MGILFIFLMLVTKSLQSIDVKEEKYCDCYDKCHKNFTVNGTIHEQLKAACERGCRFYSLVLHSTQDANPTGEKAMARERCKTSCSQSYMNSTEATACIFGCSSTKLADVDFCTLMNQSPQDVLEFVLNDSKAVIHIEEPELDDVLIDISLKKQLETSMGHNRDGKHKLPEIIFKNLPITKEERSNTQLVKCPKFYEFYVKLALHHRKLTSSELYFVGSVLLVAVIFFAVNRQLEKHRNFWRHVFINIIEDDNDMMKFEDSMMPTDIVLIDCIPRKEGMEDFHDEILEETKNRIRDDYGDVTLVYYEKEDCPYHSKFGHNSF